MLYDIIVLW